MDTPVFRQRALDDVERYEGWRQRTNPAWEPIADDLLDAIRHPVSRYRSFSEIPYKPLAVRGVVAPVKRLLVWNDPDAGVLEPVVPGFSCRLHELFGEE